MSQSNVIGTGPSNIGRSGARRHGKSLRRLASAALLVTALVCAFAGMSSAASAEDLGNLECIPSINYGGPTSYPELHVNRPSKVTYVPNTVYLRNYVSVLRFTYANQFVNGFNAGDIYARTFFYAGSNLFGTIYWGDKMPFTAPASVTVTPGYKYLVWTNVYYLNGRGATITNKSAFLGACGT
jgi:hypothetical protein